MSDRLSRLDQPTVDRFWSYVDRKGDDECWPWTGYLHANGYGVIGAKKIPPYKGNWRTSRLAYVISVGPIPEGLQIDHICHDPAVCKGGPKCKHRRCCNPAHLEAVTHRENSLRSTSPPAVNSRKTHCPQGHEYTPENIYRYKNCRRCRECHFIYDARRRNRAVGV